MMKLTVRYVREDPLGGPVHGTTQQVREVDLKPEETPSLAITWLGKRDPEIVSLLARVLQSGDAFAGWVCHHLRSIGKPAAQPAIPQLESLLVNLDISTEAMNALLEIWDDPTSELLRLARSDNSLERSIAQYYLFDAGATVLRLPEFASLIAESSPKERERILTFAPHYSDIALNSGFPLLAQTHCSGQILQDSKNVLLRRKNADHAGFVESLVQVLSHARSEALGRSAIEELRQLLCRRLCKIAFVRCSRDVPRGSVNGSKSSSVLVERAPPS